MPKDAPPNGAAPTDSDNTGDVPVGPRRRVSGMQAKLHRWAAADPGRRFDDLFNLVHDPATLIVACDRVANNRGAKTAGSDGWTVARIEAEVGVTRFLDDLRTQIKAGEFRPQPVRERKIPKPGGSGKVRRLGIPTVADRVVQAALKLVLEPIFEADFEPVSYGFRPERRAHDAIAEIHLFGTQGYRWVLDADIEACFDSDRPRGPDGPGAARVKGQAGAALVKAFLKAGILTELGEVRGHPDRHAARRHPVPAAGQHRAVGARRAPAAGWKPGGRCRPESPPGQAEEGPAELAPGPLRGRLRGAHRRDPRRRHRGCAKRSLRCSLRWGCGCHQAKTRIVHMSRGVRLPRLPHPVATQEGHQQVARLHLHRRPAIPVGEGQDPCPDPQDVTARPQGTADPDQPDHAWLDQLLQARRRATHLQQAPAPRLVADRADDANPAPLEVEGRPPLAHRPHRPVASHQRRTGSSCSTPRRYPSRGTATGATRSPTPGSALPEPTHGRNRGEPVALRDARRVRRAAWGNGPAAMPAPRPRPTHPKRPRHTSRVAARPQRPASSWL